MAGELPLNRQPRYFSPSREPNPPQPGLNSRQEGHMTGTHASDEQLLRDFVKGDRTALSQLAERHERSLLGLSSGLLGGRRDMACDAVQETWVRVFFGRTSRAIAASSRWRRTRLRIATATARLASLWPTMYRSRWATTWRGVRSTAIPAPSRRASWHRAPGAWPSGRPARGSGRRAPSAPQRVAP